MTDYNKVDIKWLNKFFDILNKLNRAQSSYRKDKLCNREIFIRRTLNKWFTGKYLEIIKSEKSGFQKWIGPYDLEDIHINKKKYIRIILCEYYLGWTTSIKFTFQSACSSNVIEVEKFTFNDFIDIKFRNSSEEIYSSIFNMFNDDSGE